MSSLRPERVTHIVFDVDGTLVHGTDDIKRDIWENYLFPDKKEEIKQANRLFDMLEPFPDGKYHQGDRMDRIAFMLGKWTPDSTAHRFDEQVLHLANIFSLRYDESVTSVSLEKPDSDTIAALYREKVLHVASNVPTESLAPQLVSWNVRHYFTTINGKPRSKIESLFDILSNYNLDAEQLLMVGDSEVDFLSAQEVSCQFCAIGDVKFSGQKDVTRLQRIAQLSHLFDLGIEL